MRRAAPVLAALLLAGCGGGADPTPPGEVIPVADRDPAPPVAGDLLGGGTFDPASTDGQVTVVNFWGSWCPPCRLEVPELQELADANPDVLVVGSRSATAPSWPSSSASTRGSATPPSTTPTASSPPRSGRGR